MAVIGVRYDVYGTYIFYSTHIYSSAKISSLRGSQLSYSCDLFGVID